jgi:hypothetical protein
VLTIDTRGGTCVSRRTTVVRGIIEFAMIFIALFEPRRVRRPAR